MRARLTATTLINQYLPFQHWQRSVTSADVAQEVVTIYGKLVAQSVETVGGSRWGLRLDHGSA